MAILNHKMQGLTAGQARSTLASASWKRADVVMVDSMGNIMNIPAQSDIPLVATQMAESLGYPRNQKAKDYMEQYEKDYALKELAPQGFKVGAKDTSGRYGPAKEYDVFVLSLTAAEAADAIQMRDIVLKELQSAHSLGANDIHGKPVPFEGMHGKRSVTFTEEHTNTGDMHFHFLVNRHSFDMVGREVSRQVDFSKNAVLQTALDNIQREFMKAGLTHGLQFASNNNTAVSNNAQQQNAQQQAAQQVAQAGGIAPGVAPTMTVSVPSAQGQQTFVQAPLTPDAVGMQTQSASLKKNATSLIAEAQRLMSEADSITQSAAKIDQALQVMADNEVLRSTLTSTHETLEKTNETLEAVTKAFEAKAVEANNLTEENTQLTESRDGLHRQLLTVGDTIANKGESLGLNPDQMDALRNGQELESIVAGIADELATWNEACDLLPDEFASALQENPLDNLEKMVNELMEARTELPRVTQERDTAVGERNKVQVELVNTRDQLETANKALVAKEAEIEAMKASFDVRLAQEVERVQAADRARVQAETNATRAQEQYTQAMEEVAKVNKVKNAIGLIVMNGQKPEDVYRHTPEVREDAAVLQTIGKFMDVTDKLREAEGRVNEAKDQIARMESDRQEAMQANTQAEAMIGEMNDAGVKDIKELMAAYKEMKAELTKTKQTLETMKAQAAQATQVTKPPVATPMSAKIAGSVPQPKRPLTPAQEADVKFALKNRDVVEAAKTLVAKPELGEAMAFLAQNPDMVKFLKMAQANPALAEVAIGRTGAEPIQEGLVNAPSTINTPTATKTAEEIEAERLKNENDGQSI